VYGKVDGVLRRIWVGIVSYVWCYTRVRYRGLLKVIFV